MNKAVKFIAEVEALTGCAYGKIPAYTLTELDFNYPGKVLLSAGNLVLCEADQAYTDGKATGDPRDYVIAVNDINHDVVILWEDPMMVEGNTSII